MDPITTFIIIYFIVIELDILFYVRKNITPSFISWGMLITPIVNIILLFYFILGNCHGISIKSIWYSIKNNFTTYLKEIRP